MKSHQRDGTRRTGGPAARTRDHRDRPESSAASDAIHRGARMREQAHRVSRTEAAAARGAPAVVQRAVAVTGGSFDTKRYEPYFWDDRTKALKHYGAKIILEFTPSPLLGADRDRVSLVQSVKDEMEVTGRRSTPKGFTTESSRVSEGNRTAGFDLRATDRGWAVDQQLWNSKGALVNLDPRYAEERLSSGEAMKARPDGDLSTLESSGGGLKQGHVTSAAKSGGRWTTALLSDEPTVPLPTSKSIAGRQEFEVTALHEGAGYVGSVRWGWEVSKGGAPKILPLEKVHDAASADFRAAAKKWNEMRAPEQRGKAAPSRGVEKGLQLPE